MDFLFTEKDNSSNNKQLQNFIPIYEKTAKKTNRSIARANFQAQKVSNQKALQSIKTQKT